jgi:mannose-6-phosphate isomerase
VHALRGIGVPLRLSPTFDSKPWGGRRLESLGKSLPDGPIGESLESGPLATIDGGPFSGMTLGELAAQRPRPLLGSRGTRAAGNLNDFPLLVKLIDAQQDLSVQVHPDDLHAPPGKRGKTEAWLILESEPGGSLIVGVDSAPDPSDIQRSIVREPVAAGDIFLVPAGTIHAIGAGVMLYEIQQCSDVTYRLYDWGRPREMHLEQGLAVANPSLRALRVKPLHLDADREILVACCHFALERWTIRGSRTLRGDLQTCRVVTVLDGQMRVGDHEYARGTTFVLPADLVETSISGAGIALVGYVPDIDEDIVTPLRAQGHKDDAIRALGTGVR